MDADPGPSQGWASQPATRATAGALRRLGRAGCRPAGWGPAGWWLTGSRGCRLAGRAIGTAIGRPPANRPARC